MPAAIPAEIEDLIVKQASVAKLGFATLMVGHARAGRKDGEAVPPAELAKIKSASDHYGKVFAASQRRTHRIVTGLMETAAEMMAEAKKA